MIAEAYLTGEGGIFPADRLRYLRGAGGSAGWSALDRGAERAEIDGQGVQTWPAAQEPFAGRQPRWAGYLLRADLTWHAAAHAASFCFSGDWL